MPWHRLSQAQIFRDGMKTRFKRLPPEHGLDLICVSADGGVCVPKPHHKGHDRFQNAGRQEAPSVKMRPGTKC
jgi:hypothetical protein